MPALARMTVLDLLKGSQAMPMRGEIWSLAAGMCVGAIFAPYRKAAVRLEVVDAVEQHIIVSLRRGVELPVPAQAVIEGEVGADAPFVLRKEREQIHGVTRLQVADLPQVSGVRRIEAVHNTGGDTRC